MTFKNLLSKVIVLLLFVIFFASTTSLGYSYFDDLNDGSNDSAVIGDWMEPISTPQEFYDFIIRSRSYAEDRYYLTNDLDFTGFTWELDSVNNRKTFKGVFDGNDHTISNLTIFSDNDSYKYLGLFPRLVGATVKNLRLDNVNMVIDSSVYLSRTYRSGLIAATITGISEISNITITNSSVMSSKGPGSGGIVGYISGTSSEVTIKNIKATNLQVLSFGYYTGGIVGQINRNTLNVTITDIDLDVDIYNSRTSSYIGGVVGRNETGANLTIERAIVELNPQNTLITTHQYLEYGKRYNGGIIGVNQGDALINNTFFTGNLITHEASKGDDVGTIIGRHTDGTTTLSNNFYAQTQFLNVNGSVLYTPDPTSTGVFGTQVGTSTMPSNSWWDNFYTDFNNGLWGQDVNGRLYLIR